MGAVSGVDTGTRGTYYFDAFESRRSSYIGQQGSLRGFELGKATCLTVRQVMMRKAGLAKMVAARGDHSGLALVGEGELTDYLFAGERYEEQLGLYWVGSRWLDAALGRWIQPDTLVPGADNPQRWDRFAYANNNPLNYTDPSGHRPCETVDGTCLSERQVTKLWKSTHSNERNKNNNKTVQADSPNLSKIISGDLEETGPITGFILQLPGSTEDWSSLATGLDVLAWLTDIYAASAVTYAGFGGAALPAPLVAAGLPEVPLATGLAGMAIAEL